MDGRIKDFLSALLVVVCSFGFIVYYIWLWTDNPLGAFYLTLVLLAIIAGLTSG